MNKMCLAYLVALLVVLHLISTQVVQAQNPTTKPPATTPKANMTTTANKTTTHNGCGRTDAFTLLLLPLAVASSLLSWS